MESEVKMAMIAEDKLIKVYPKGNARVQIFIPNLNKLENKIAQDIGKTEKDNVLSFLSYLGIDIVEEEPEDNPHKENPGRFGHGY